MIIKKILNKILHYYDMKIVSFKYFKSLNDTKLENDHLKKKINLVLKFNAQDNRIINNLFSSESQLGQDLFVLNELKYKKNGYFVEFGAGNGKHLSNTYLLEKKYSFDIDDHIDLKINKFLKK